RRASSRRGLLVATPDVVAEHPRRAGVHVDRVRDLALEVREIPAERRPVDEHARRAVRRLDLLERFAGIAPGQGVTDVAVELRAARCPRAGAIDTREREPRRARERPIAGRRGAVREGGARWA